MMKKVFVIFGVIFLLFVMALIIMGGPDSTPEQAAGTVEQGQYTEPTGVQPAPPAAPASAATGEHVIQYTASGFSPASVAAKKGDIVKFLNMHTQDMWPAVDPHPSHTGYSGSSSCGTTAFDACRPVLPGSSWSMQLAESGTWTFHDHLNPGAKGSITVQ
jgi:plastocyanin